MKKFILTPLAVASALCSGSLSALEAISDRDLSEIGGQAFISVEANSTDAHDFTKVNLGLITETLFNADLLKVGEFERDADDDRSGDGTVRMVDANGNNISGGIHDKNNNGVYDADIIIENFALGSVLNYEDADLAEPDPFLLKNPYIEIAQTGSGANKRVSGVRVGFEKAKGNLSGDLISLTGKIDGLVRGENVTATVFGIELHVNFVTAFGLLDGSNADGARDVRGEGDQSFANAGYLKRASWFGVQEGSAIENVETAVGNLTVRVANCSAVLDLGFNINTNVNTCFPASQFKTIYVGDPTVTDEDAEAELEAGGSSGVFISLQTEDVEWSDLSGVAGATTISTERGAYLNIPSYSTGAGVKYPINLSFNEAEAGLPRVATCVGQLKGC